MNLKNSILAGGLAALSGCESFVDVIKQQKRFPECGENVRVLYVADKNFLSDEWSVSGAKNKEEDLCATDAWNHRDCKAVRDKAASRVIQILSTDCTDKGLFSISKLDSNFYDLSSVQGTTGDCTPVISEMEEKLRSIKPNCSN